MVGLIPKKSEKRAGFTPPKSVGMSLKKKIGFTLIEVMVTVSILAFGIVAIYEALFICLDTFSYYSNSLQAQTWLEEKIWEVQDELIRQEYISTGQTNGTVKIRNKMFNWRTGLNRIGGDQSLYRLDLSLGWTEGNRKPNISREVYVLNPRIEK